MANVTINERLWGDTRFFRLIERVGRHNAVGVLVGLWNFTYSNPQWKGLLPPSVYAQIDHGKDLLECEFVSVRASGDIYVKGSKRYFQVISSRKKAGAMGGATKAARQKKTRGSVVVPQQVLAHATASANDTAPQVADTEKEGVKISRLIALYAEGFKAKYGARAVITGKDAGVLKRLNKTIGEEKLGMLLTAYLSMQDPWFVKKHHDLTTFEQNLQKIGVATQTGKDPDAKEDYTSAWMAAYEEKKNRGKGFVQK